MAQVSGTVVDYIAFVSVSRPFKHILMLHTFGEHQGAEYNQKANENRNAVITQKKNKAKTPVGVRQIKSRERLTYH
jgi:hypothetical protein